MQTNNLERLRRLLDEHERVLVLTGAGCSTGSGIPDYRDEEGQWKRSAPIQYQAFMRETHTRRRYWARSMVGWPLIRDAEPNQIHHLLAEMQRSGTITTLVTQNVDGLHQRAGHRGVIDLHGNLQKVVCTRCARRMDRQEFQNRLHSLNASRIVNIASIAPDGDADLDETDLSRFVVPDCEQCSGILKPDVVFFGENVPRARVARVFDAIERSDAVLVVGSSLMVYSGYRFVVRALDRSVPVAIINRGRTRADDAVTIKVQGECAEVLGALHRGPIRSVTSQAENGFPGPC